MSARQVRLSTYAVLFAGVLSACGGGGGGGSSSHVVPAPPSQTPGSGSPSSSFKHIVLIVQENRTFNDFFATFPGVVGTTVGKMRQGGKTVSVNLTKEALTAPRTLSHVYAAYHTAYRNGHMDNFNHIKFSTNNMYEGTQPYQYVDPNDIQPYWTMASSYGIADEMFQTQGSGSFTAHQDLIRGGTAIDANDSMVDDPSTNSSWGCLSPPGAKESLITTSLQYLKYKGPYPCTDHFPGSYETLQDLLDAKSISWKYYAPKPTPGSVGAIWNAFLIISSVYNNPSEYSAHISTPEKNVLKDIAKNKLPAMSWVIPDAANSDHPGYSVTDTGPSWVSSIVNAIGQSSYWNSTAIIIVWDDWGGFYDPVKPPKLDEQGGPGFRVPMIVVSPYTPAGEISNTVYEFGGIVRFIEDNWDLGRLGTTDSTSTSIANMFDFSQSPRQFQHIGSKYSRAYFLRQKPSGLPVDTE